MNSNRLMLLVVVLGLTLGEGACIGAWGPCGSLAESPPASCHFKQGPITIGVLVEDSVYGFVPRAGPFVIAIGDTMQLRVSGLTYIDGIKWGSDDESTATVKREDSTTEARVVGRKAGTARIWVSAAGKRDSVTVTVRSKALPR